MPEYDFRVLSPLDFEVLVRDLLQEETGLLFDSFKSGKDGGIDLRSISDPEGTTIVQAKHYVESGFNALFSVLRREEAGKVRRLSPENYVLATSVPLFFASPYSMDDAP